MIPGKPPRALHICTRFLRGGSEKRLVDIINALPDWDHHVIIGEDSDPELAAAQLAPATVTVEQTLLRPVKPLADVKAIWRLRKLMRSGGYDLVVTHQSKGGFVGRIAACLAGRPPVVHSLSMANFGPGYSRKESGIFRVTERALSPLTHGYATVGSDLAQRYRDIGVPAAKLHVIRSGVRLPPATRTHQEAREHLYATYQIDRERPLIAYVGSLDERKGVLGLPKLLQRIRLDLDVTMAVAGVGPLAERLDHEARQLGIGEHLQLLGFVSPIDDVIIGADVIVLLSSAEGVPQVLVQAAAVGTPFISFDVDGTRELIAMGACGQVVPIGDLDAAITQALVQLQAGVRSAPIDTEPWTAHRIRLAYRELALSVVGGRE